jgi:hypothetical protein
MLVKFYMSDFSVWSRDVGTVPPKVGDYVRIYSNVAPNPTRIEGKITARRLTFSDGAPAPVAWEVWVDNTPVPW